jgi:hypothetical protein
VSKGAGAEEIACITNHRENIEKGALGSNRTIARAHGRIYFTGRGIQGTYKTDSGRMHMTNQ